MGFCDFPGWLPRRKLARRLKMIVKEFNDYYANNFEVYSLKTSRINYLKVRMLYKELLVVFSYLTVIVNGQWNNHEVKYSLMLEFYHHGYFMTQIQNLI